MQFFLLGPFEVREGETQIPVTSRRQKLLLAFLLVHANEVVARDRLVDELWDGNPPATAESALHGLVSQLRKLSIPLVTRAPGYAIEIDRQATDTHRFEGLVANGHDALIAGDSATAAQLLQDALGLWRGTPFEDVGEAAFARTERARLEEVRLVALEDRIEADLQLGLGKELVAELQTLTGREPYRERFHKQLMISLYRSGRQADALAAYRNLYRLFDQELGLEPSRELQELERDMLRQDPSLLARPGRKVPASRRRLPVAAVAALVLACIAVGTFALTRGGSGHTAPVVVPADSVAVIDPRTNRIVDAIPVGSTPIALAAGEGSVWVVNSADGTVSRIDPAARKVSRTIGLGTPATDVAVGFRSVWVANGTAGTLTRIDPATGAPAETYRQAEEEPLVSPAAAGVATGNGSVWLASGTDRLLRIDPASGRTIASIRVPAGPLAVGVGSGAVWVGSLAHRVSRIESNAEDVTATIPVGDEVEGIAVGRGSVWAAVCCNSVWRIDPTSNVLVGTVPVGAVPSGVAIGDGSVWVSSYGDGTVSRINPFTGRVTARIQVGHGAVDVATGFGLVWVAVERRDVS